MMMINTMVFHDDDYDYADDYDDDVTQLTVTFATARFPFLLERLRRF